MGSLVLSDSVMVFRHWQDRDGFNYSETTSHFVWVTLYDRPLSLLTKEGIGYIASANGNVNFFEQSTLELDVAQGEKPMIHLDRKDYKRTCLWVQILVRIPLLMLRFLFILSTMKLLTTPWLLATVPRSMTKCYTRPPLFLAARSLMMGLIILILIITCLPIEMQVRSRKGDGPFV